MSFAQRRFSSAQPPASCALLGCRAVLKSRISQTAAHFLAPKIAHCSSCGSFCRISASRSARNETSAALATPGKAELVVGPVLLGILGIFAAATGLAANVVLLAQAPGMHRSQSRQLRFHLLDPLFDLCYRHCRYHHSDIGCCQAFSPNFFQLFSTSFFLLS